VTARRVSTGWGRAGVRSSDGGYVAPAMNDELWRTPATNRSLQTPVTSSALAMESEEI
jgi:phosphopantothenoylcysteine synthetase/decarboxylase